MYIHHRFNTDYFTFRSETMERVTFILFTFIVGVHLVSCKVHKIVPMQTNSDLPDSGMTLSQFASYSLASHIDSNTTLLFAGGTHYLNKSVNVSNTLEFSMLSENDTDSSPVIVCSRYNTNLVLSKITNILVTGLAFIGCSDNRIESVNRFTAKDTKFYGNKNGTTKSSLSVVNSTAIMTSVLFISNGMESREGNVRSRRMMSDSNTFAAAGGAIFVANSDLTLDDCQFDDNVATAGGAIFSEQESNLTINNSVFTSNQATRDGAVLASDGGVIWFDNCTFTDNYAADDGGVAYVYSSCTVTFNSCHFDYNRARDSGGVVYGRECVTVTISDSAIYSSQTEDSGGCVYIQEASNANIKLSNFTNNSADYGGVLIARRFSNVTVDDCLFINNSAEIDGGTLFARIQTTLTIGNSEFISNKATNNGIILAADNSAIMLNNSNFSYNMVGFDGGALSLYDSSILRMIGCAIFNSSAGDSGGTVYGRRDCHVVITDCTIYNNVAENSGGAVYVQEYSSVVIVDSNIDNNLADYGGALRVYIQSTANISKSNFSGNSGSLSGGALAAYKSSNMTIETSNFILNEGSFGSVAVAYDSDITFEYCDFLNNTSQLGGVFRILRSDIILRRTTAQYNTALSGAVLYTQGSTANIENSIIENNSAKNDGGVLYIDNKCSLIVMNTSFVENSVENDGGVLHANGKSNVTFNNSLFSNNVADHSGGVMALLGESNTTIENCTFTYNEAGDTGGVINLLQSTAAVFTSTFNSSTTGSSGGVVHMTSSTFEANNSSFTYGKAADNGGVVDAHNSSLTIVCSHFSNNIAKQGYGGAVNLIKRSISTIINNNFEENKAGESGGAFSAFTSANVKITGSTFTYNKAKMGAAIAAVQDSNIFFDSHLGYSYSNGSCQMIGAYNKTDICHNEAQSGGGIYLSSSKLGFEQETTLCHNQAGKSGGGIYAFNSSIMVNNTSIHFDSNQANSSGGALSLSKSTLNNNIIDLSSGDGMVSDIDLTLNRAMYGGALYVSDAYESDDDACSIDRQTRMYHRCFFSNIATGLMINFNNNSAASGQNLYGGLLDRCTVVSDKNSSMQQSNGIARFKDITNIESFDTISSEPVRVCLCNLSDSEHEPDCSQRTFSISMKRGIINEFYISLVAVNQINRSVDATLLSRFVNDTISASQAVRLSNTSKCSNVEFKMSFPDVSNEYQLKIFADGPCSDDNISSFHIDIYISECSCPLGFMLDNTSTECSCICDKNLEKLIEDLNCNFENESVIRQGDYWIMYLNNTDGNGSTSHSYFVHPHCPFDYCQPPNTETPIKLNEPNAEDAQCVNNRGRVLCGSCKTNHSLSLGSSKCLSCPSEWYGLLAGITIAAFFAGVMLVILLLVLNLTVAVGTLNSIIFYANIINANRSIYFGQSRLTFVPVFISWLNLDIGIDTCFFEGMDTYAKTWLQLAFPAYIIFIVILITWISACSSKFSNLIGKRNPVATLATLILLSYTKLLQTIITSFSFVRLKYPNGTTLVRWLPDANVEFFGGKHIALFLMALFILIVGLLYTALIFFWQWLLSSPNIKFFKWTKNQKLNTFIATYHNPYTPRHRYWTGLLLLVRVIVYLISAFSVSIDPRITLLSTVVIMCCLLLYKTAFIIRAYKNWLLNAMESFVYFNIAVFTILTWYTYDDFQYGIYNQTRQKVPAYISVGIMLILCLLVIIFHIYRYGNSTLYSCGQSTTLARKINARISNDDQRDGSDVWSKSTNTFKLFSVIDSRLDSGYKPPPVSGSQEKPSSSVVSIANSDDSDASTSSAELAKRSNTKKPQIKSHSVKGGPIKKTRFSLIRKNEPKCSSDNEKTTSLLTIEEDEA